MTQKILVKFIFKKNETEWVGKGQFLQHIQLFKMLICIKKLNTDLYLRTYTEIKVDYEQI